MICLCYTVLEVAPPAVWNNTAVMRLEAWIRIREVEMQVKVE